VDLWESDVECVDYFQNFQNVVRVDSVNVYIFEVCSWKKIYSISIL
jgi:hypothetical protein